MNDIRDVRVTNMHSSNGIGIGLGLWLIAMVLMGNCGSIHVRLENPSPVTCDCRCAP